MSRYASKAELVEVIKDTIRTDWNQTGMPTDVAAYNLAGILRELDIQGEGIYGWTCMNCSPDWPGMLRRNLRRSRVVIALDALTDLANR